MKTLSRVSKKDAIEIIKAGYPEIIHYETWIPTRRTNAKRTTFGSEEAPFWFAFANDRIYVIEHKTSSIPLTCYMKAHELGYKTELYDFAERIREEAVKEYASQISDEEIVKESLKRKDELSLSQVPHISFQSGARWHKQQITK